MKLESHCPARYFCDAMLITKQFSLWIHMYIEIFLSAYHSFHEDSPIQRPHRHTHASFLHIFVNQFNSFIPVSRRLEVQDTNVCRWLSRVNCSTSLTNIYLRQQSIATFWIVQIICVMFLLNVFLIRPNDSLKLGVCVCSLPVDHNVK